MHSLIKKISSVLLAALLLSACAQDIPVDDSFPEAENMPVQPLSESSDQNSPNLPALPPSASDEAVLDAYFTEAEVEFLDVEDQLNNLPEVELTPDLRQALEADSIQACDAMEGRFKELCYQAGSYAQNAPSVEADLRR